MLNTQELVAKFSSLQAYEVFNLEWTTICAKLNPSAENKRRLREMKRRTELLGI